MASRSLKEKANEIISEKSFEWVPKGHEEEFDRDARKQTAGRERGDQVDNETLLKDEENTVTLHPTDYPEASNLRLTTIFPDGLKDKPSSESIVIGAVGAKSEYFDISPSEKIVLNVFKDANGNLKIEVASHQYSQQEMKADASITRRKPQGDKSENDEDNKDFGKSGKDEINLQKPEIEESNNSEGKKQIISAEGNSEFQEPQIRDLSSK